jgi:CRISPR-associated protein Cas5d
VIGTEKENDYGMHVAKMSRALKLGNSTLPIHFGTSDCIGYVSSCWFDEGVGFYDDVDETRFDLMFYGYCYPNVYGKMDEFGKRNENGENRVFKAFDRLTMKNGRIKLREPIDCEIKVFDRYI